MGLKFNTLCVIVAGLVIGATSGCTRVDVEYKGLVGEEKITRKLVRRIGDCGPEYWREVNVIKEDGSKLLFIDQHSYGQSPDGQLNYIRRKNPEGKTTHINGSWKFECGIWGNGKEINHSEQKEWEDYLRVTELK